ncbi:hypothetical protein HPB50_028027 [Hyalomma asiaticum]|nr:hypothetical protein HPB50_028027 [Hyalomma asiaticum]
MQRVSEGSIPGHGCRNSPLSAEKLKYFNFVASSSSSIELLEQPSMTLPLVKARILWNEPSVLSRAGLSTAPRKDRRISYSLVELRYTVPRSTSEPRDPPAPPAGPARRPPFARRRRACPRGAGRVSNAALGPVSPG